MNNKTKVIIGSLALTGIVGMSAIIYIAQEKPLMFNFIEDKLKSIITPKSELEGKLKISGYYFHTEAMH